MGGLTDASGKSIRIHGHDLVSELIPSWSFVELVHLLCFGDRPTPQVARMLDALLVTVAEHGLTPSATVARLTYLGAPESLQGAVAAGLLGAGSALLGTPEQVARLLSDLSEQPDPSAAVSQLIERTSLTGEVIPGFGHPIHRDHDPRAAALIGLQVDLGIPTSHMELAREIARALSDRKGRPIPLNAAGAIGAIVCDLGYPPIMGRAITIIARSAGLVAHVIDEAGDPLAHEIWALTRTLGAPTDADSARGASGDADH